MSISLKLSDYISFLMDLVSGRRTKAELSAANKRATDCSSYLDFSSCLKILDLANGALRPQSLILASMGYDVIGVDIVNYPKATITSVLYKVAQLIFRLRLPKFATAQRPRLVCAKVESLPFPDATFDMITSIAAFEHFLDADGAIAECHRVLKPGGVAWISIHVFTTLSGGHNIGMRLATISAPPEEIEPWDHLRERKLPFPVPLNEWRIGDYLKSFEKRFEVVRHEAMGSEGVNLLTSKIRKELFMYSEEELTCGCYLFLVKKT